MCEGEEGRSECVCEDADLCASRMRTIKSRDLKRKETGFFYAGPLDGLNVGSAVCGYVCE